MILDVLLCFLVALGVDPPDCALARPEWEGAATRFQHAQRIDGMRSVLWWLTYQDTLKPSVLRSVWLDSQSLPDRVEAMRFAFSEHDCVVEMQARSAEIDRLETLAALYPHRRVDCDDRTAALTVEREAYNLLWQAHVYDGAYPARYALSNLRHMLGESDFYAGVMPGRWWR